MSGPPRARLARAAAGAGAVGAQVSQALASLVLQVLVARTLGGAGLSTYALLYGGVVLATAVVTGLVGDSLTVVDRSVAAVRSALAWWALGSAAVLGAVAVALVSVLGVGADGGAAGGADGAALGARGAVAVAMGAAVAAFVLEDCLRRLLMVCERFWRLVLVDGAALVGALATVVVLRAGGTTSLTGFLVALAVGQVVGGVVAVALLPRPERWLAPWRGASLGVVVGFGTWRAAQQTLRPGMLTAARALVIAALGAAAYGQVEAARLLVTPLTLVVGGVGSLLLVRYARAAGQAARDAEAAGAADAPRVARAAVRAGVRRADRAAAGLLAASVAIGGLATLGTPLLGPLVTAGRFDVDRGAVAGWVAYAATAAVVLPYGALAAVLRRQRAAFVVRLADSAASVGLVAVVLAAGAGAATMPWALSAGSLVSALVLRALVLSPGRGGARGRGGGDDAAPPATPR